MKITNNKNNNIEKRDKDEKEDKKIISNNNNINTIDNNFDFIDKNTITYKGDNNQIYLSMKINDKKFEDEKKIIRKNKNVKPSSKIKKKINLVELFTNNDKKIFLSNCSTPTVSTSHSSVITSNNNNSIMSVYGKNGKIQEELDLTSCNEINLSYIK